MRRIPVVDDDLHTRLAMGLWLKQCGFRVAITDGGETDLAALNDRTFDRRRLHAEHARFRVDQGISRPRADRPADCDPRLRFFRSRKAG